MTFVTKLETESAAFYEEKMSTVPELQDAMQSWVKENHKFEKQVKQTYYGVITDTLESNYAFEGLTGDDFVLDLSLPEGAGADAVLKKAAEIEETIQAFYLKAAGMSEGLMADIPRLFKKIAKKRDARIASLA